MIYSCSVVHSSYLHLPFIKLSRFDISSVKFCFYPFHCRVAHESWVWPLKFTSQFGTQSSQSEEPFMSRKQEVISLGISIIKNNG